MSKINDILRQFFDDEHASIKATSTSELQRMLRKYEDQENYEYCLVIKKEIDKRLSK